jgi:hypothetical protein
MLFFFMVLCGLGPRPASNSMDSVAFEIYSRRKNALGTLGIAHFSEQWNSSSTETE